MKQTRLFLLGALCPIWAFGQAVYLNNPSFEGEPQDATVPTAWFTCQLGATPDVLPGVWGVYQEASEGETYLGLITRDDGSWEDVSQRLPQSLKAGQCYTFSVDLANAKNYETYNGPLKLRIWAGRQRCQKDQLLYESPRIKEARWASYEVEFTPEQPVHYLIIEAYHKDGRFAYRGNILIDNISPIEKCVRAFLD